MVRKSNPLKPKKRGKNIFGDGLRRFAAKKNKKTITKKLKGK